MSIHSRLSNFEKSLQYRELALLWLKTSQGRSGYSEYWKIGEFQPWASENEEAGLMYHLAFEVNGAVITAAQGWRKESIDMEDIERSPGRKVDHFLNEWVMLSRSKVLVARGEIFAARDEVLALLKTDDLGTNP